MTVTLIFLTAIAAFIINKIVIISKRHQLKPNVEKRLLTAGILLILFLVTNATLPYPESLYWFIVLAVLTVVMVLSLSVAKKEILRFILLPNKQKALNVAFYGLLTTVTILFV